MKISIKDAKEWKKIHMQKRCENKLCKTRDFPFGKLFVFKLSDEKTQTNNNNNIKKQSTKCFI